MIRSVKAATSVLALWVGVAAAQSSADLEPAVQTSEPAVAAGQGTAVPAPHSPASAAAQPVGQTAAGTQSPARSVARSQSAARTAGPAATPTGALAPAAAVAGAGAVQPGGKDRIELDTTQISGNRELPKVMYVVPWRKADVGDFAGRPPNSLLDEALTPVDRDVFRRQNRYYSALEAGAAASKSQPETAAGKTAVPEAKDEK